MSRLQCGMEEKRRNSYEVRAERRMKKLMQRREQEKFWTRRKIKA